MSPDKNRLNTGLNLTVIALTAAIAGCTFISNLNPLRSEHNDAPPLATTSSVPRGSSTMHPVSIRQSGQNLVLVSEAVVFAESAPDQYVVQTGDTLWDIAATFLRDPWYWPEVWYVNPQIVNPHLIYPGDVLAMITIDGQQRITNTGGPTGVGPTGVGPTSSGPTYRVSPVVRATPLSESITSIPHEQIAAFLSKGVIIEKGQSDELPYILASRGDHLMASAGNEVYIRGGRPSPNGTRFNVVHIGEQLRDPDDNDVIGYMGVYVGEGFQSRGGDPATIALTDTNREALVGDRLVPETLRLPLNFFPKAPDIDIEGRIISVVDGVTLIGQYQVVILNRGARNGLAPGDVLSVFQTGKKVRDRYAGRSFRAAGSASRGGTRVTLPEEQAGTIMIFKVFDRIGYGLVMEATSDIHVLDTIRNPI